MPVTFEGFIGPVRVYNVATHVTGKDFCIFEVDADGPSAVSTTFEMDLEATN